MTRDDPAAVIDGTHTPGISQVRGAMRSSGGIAYSASGVRLTGVSGHDRALLRRDGSTERLLPARERGLLLHVGGEVRQGRGEPRGVVLRGNAVRNVLGHDVDARPRIGS